MSLQDDSHQSPKPRATPARPLRDRSWLAVAPMFPAALGLAAGVLADRVGLGWGTAGWCVWAFVGVWVARMECRGTIVGLLLAFVGIGGAWHHRAWSDLAGDDLARGMAERAEPRPSWLRGVVVETPLFRADLERPGGQGTTRTVVDEIGRAHV